MEIKKHAELSALCNMALLSAKIIEEEYKNDIPKNAHDAFVNLHDDIVRIMDWTGSELTKEHKIHDVGFYFIGENDGEYPESRVANDKGILFTQIYTVALYEIIDMIMGGDEDKS